MPTGAGHGETELCCGQHCVYVTPTEKISFGYCNYQPRCLPFPQATVQTGNLAKDLKKKKITLQIRSYSTLKNEQHEQPFVD